MSNYDKKEQYDQVVEGLLPDEVVLAVFDCQGLGAGFVGVTDRRIVYQDKAAIGGESAVTSVPYRAVSSVSFAADRNVIKTSTSTVIVSYSGGVLQATFRGADKARYIHDTVLIHAL